MLLSDSLKAATGYEGYAIYRDGVPFGVNSTWHAGLMYSSSSLPLNAVIHITGLGYELMEITLKEYISHQGELPVIKEKMQFGLLEICVLKV